MEASIKQSGISSITKRIWKLSSLLGVWLVVVLFFIILSLTTETFLTYANLMNVARQICVNALVALGAGYVILGGEIDLSTGTLCAFVGCIAAMLMVSGMNMWLAIIIAIVIGTLIGCVTGVIVTYLRIPSFIASLGMSYVILGANLLFTNSEPISGLPEPFMILGRGYIADVIPVPVIILLLFYIVGAFILRYTPFGRDVISVGENKIAARLSGIDVIKTKILIFAIGGFTASAAGVVLTSRLSSGQPMAAGDIGLTAIAAVFVGGTEKGSALDVLAGSVVLGLVNNGLNLLEVNSYWQKIALGLIITLAVLIDQVRASKAVTKNKK
jgi:ribose/xylose/arabinose/galactoside ABC-type transport system permease subunit